VDLTVHPKIPFVALFCFSISLVLPQVDGSPATSGNMGITENDTASPSPSPLNATDKVQVVASFYPIFEFVKKVGGDRVEVTSLIPVGTEPHDFDPTVQQVQNAQAADMVVFNGAGFEEEHLMNMNAKFLVDTSKGLNLTTDTAGHNEENGGDNELSYDTHI
jgi:zinc transport system substrate-binding protein